MSLWSFEQLFFLFGLCVYVQCVCRRFEPDIKSCSCVALHHLTSSPHFSFYVIHNSQTHCTDLIVFSWSTFYKLQAVPLWAWCTNLSNPCKPVNVHLSSSRWLFFFSFLFMSWNCGCLVYAKLQRMGFWTKGNIRGSLRPTQSLNWKVITGLSAAATTCHMQTILDFLPRYRIQCMIAM